jgi:hypothetical protein
MNKLIEGFFSVLTFLGMLVFVLFGHALLLAIPVMILWNMVIPELFHLPEINYFQAFVLYVLCGLLFKNPNKIEKKKES